jgi:hypothetical protein
MKNWITHGNRLGEDPFQVGASCLEVEGMADHRGQEASFQEGENQDQEGRADGLREGVRGLVVKVEVNFWAYVHQTQEGEGVRRIRQEDPSPWEDRSWMAAGQDVEDRNRNHQEGDHCLIRRQL